MFQIIIKDDFVYSKVSQNIYTTVYISYDGKNFPDSEWTDFPIGIMCMWVEGVKNILCDKKIKGTEQLFFWDGDFRLDCTLEENMFHIEMKRGDEKQDEIYLKISDFLQALLESIERIIQIVEICNCRSYEYRLLKKKRKWLMSVLC